MIQMVVALSTNLWLALAPDPADGAYKRSRVNDPEVALAQRHCLGWQENSRIVFNQNTAGNPALPGEGVFAAVSKSFQTWNAAFASCGSLSFSEGPRVADRKLGYSVTAGGANVNQVLFRTRKCQVVAPAADPCWKDDSCNNAYDCWNHDAGSIGVTTTTYDVRSGRIFDADIELNASNFKFSTVDSPVCVPPELTQGCVSTDVQNTVTHEVGHLIGLDHAADVSSTMSAKANPGELNKRTLDSGTERAVCEIYPKGQASQDCVDSQGASPSSDASDGGCAIGGHGAVSLVALALGVLAFRHGTARRRSRG